MNKKKLLEIINKKTLRKQELSKQSETCEDTTSLRSMISEIESLTEEIRSLQEFVDSIPDDGEPDGRTAAVTGAVPAIVVSGNVHQETRAAADTENLEYRNAFMEYVLHGTEIPAELKPAQRADTFTGVADASAVIPTTILNEIVKELKVRGQLYNLVRKTSVQGGVQVPVLTLKPTATWITEAATSDRQKVTVNTYVQFSYFGLECKIAVSLLASVTTLAMFEAELVPLATEAIIKALEIGIVNGTGTGQMLGITRDPAVKTSQKITLTPTDFKSWESWKKKIFAKIPLAYRNGIFLMGAGTFDGYIDGMVDSTGQPIGRVNYGITGGTTYRFGGKEVLEVEEDVIPSYDTADPGAVVAIFMNPTDYCINSNLQLRVTRWFDEDTNQWITKAILICDGKLIDPAGVILVLKGAE